MSSIYLFYGTSVEWCWGGERGRGGTGGSSPCSEALLRAVAELLAWIEARPWRQAAAEKFCSVLPFLPPQKNAPPRPFLTFYCSHFSPPQLLKLHALGALLWDVKNEKS